MMRWTSNLLVIGAICVVGLAANLARAGSGARFQALEFADGSREIMAVSAEAVSADGKVVVGRLSVPANNRVDVGAFRWTPETGVVDLDLGEEFLVHDLSDDGKVLIGGDFETGSYRVEGDTVTPIAGPVLEGDADWPMPPSPFVFPPVAWAMSSDGAVLVGGVHYSTSEPVSSQCREQGFIYEDGITTPISELLGEETDFFTAIDVSSDGSVVLAFPSNPLLPSDPNTPCDIADSMEPGDIGAGFLIEGDTKTPIPDPPLAGIAFRHRLSGDGKVIAGEVRGSGFNRYANGSWTTIAPVEEEQPCRHLEQVGGMTFDGSVIVGSTFSFNTGDSGGFVWGDTAGACIWDQAGGLRNLKRWLEEEHGLDLDGWHLTAATDISPDGRVIVGAGLNPQDEYQAWIVTLEERCPSIGRRGKGNDFKWTSREHRKRCKAKSRHRNKRAMFRRWLRKHGIRASVGKRWLEMFSR